MLKKEGYALLLVVLQMVFDGVSSDLWVLHFCYEEFLMGSLLCALLMQISVTQIFSGHFLPGRN